MTRTTEAKVKEVIEVDDNLWDDGLINHAHIITDNVYQNNESLNDDTLESIETYVAAHLYAIKEGKPAQEKTGKATTKLQGSFGKGLEGTYWGQMALQLDTSGTLATLTGSETGAGTVSAEHLGS